MLLDLKAGRHHIRDATCATVYVKGFPTLTAEEMVMMPPVGRLVAHIIAAQSHGPNFTGLPQVFEMPIDRRDAQRRHHAGREIENLSGVQGTRSAADDLPYGTALTGDSGAHADVSFESLV